MEKFKLQEIGISHFSAVKIGLRLTTDIRTCECFLYK